MKYDKIAECYIDQNGLDEELDIQSTEYLDLSEATKDGKDVELNKPFRTPGQRKKFAVYVKNPAGKVVVVRFGDPNLSIKRDDPERRKSFRARHSCDTAKDKTTPRYWSCRFWEADKSVSDILKEEASHISVMPASEDDYYDVVGLDQQFPNNQYSLRQFKKPEYSLSVAKDNDNNLHGYILTKPADDGSTLIVKMLTDQNSRNMGVGSKMLDHVIQKHGNVSLNVRHHNEPAISLYQSKGFKLDHVKPSYYMNGDDAYHMRLSTR